MFVVLDLEVYVNYFLATFTFENGNVTEYERRDDVQTIGAYSLYEIVGKLGHQGCTLVTFNGKRYDMPLLSLAMTNASNAVIKEASDYIIKHDAMWWDVERRYEFKTIEVDHIDIINLLPLFESLKLYGGRNGTAQMQDLPFDEADTVTPMKATELRSYCRKDCRVTWELFVSQWEQIQLRVTLGEQYDMDLRSKSDAQIAEAVISKEYERVTGTKLIKPIDIGGLPTEVSYTAPDWVSFDDPELTKLVTMIEFEGLLEGFKLHPKNSKPIPPKWMKRKTVKIDDRRYAVGLGGLHAQNKYESYFSQDGKQLIDLDVTSYYPRLILNNNYVPPNMGQYFTDIYGSLVDRRIAAKLAGDKVQSETLKICINGSYGKLGSKYSAFYAPALLLGVTFSGQLALLMLIEKMAENGIQCVSANTDGVTILAEAGQDFVIASIINQWQYTTGLNLEATNYKSIHYRDVNNYFALTMDGKVKRKGIFKNPGIAKNPAASIVFDAAIDYVLHGKSIITTIQECDDVKKFLSVRTVKGGAAKDGEYLGKAVRWYYSTETDTAINYVTNGNQVAKTMGAMPMMDLGPIPADLDIQWYVSEAFMTLTEIGYHAWR